MWVVALQVRRQKMELEHHIRKQQAALASLAAYQDSLQVPLLASLFLSFLRPPADVLLLKQVPTRFLGNRC